MSKYKIGMYVDGMIYLEVEAETEFEARAKLEGMVAEGEFYEIMYVEVVAPEDSPSEI